MDKAFKWVKPVLTIKGLAKQSTQQAITKKIKAQNTGLQFNNC